MSYSTEQEAFWAGEFGDDYIQRNQDEQWIASNAAFFAQVLRRTAGVSSILECGSNIGLNLQALAGLRPDCELAAIEINETAAGVLRKRQPTVTVYNQSVLDFRSERKWDLTFSKGVLIHTAPDQLGKFYQVLHECSERYILMAEYYNPTPLEISYRGNSGKLFKRDFAGEFMDSYGAKLVDYGFAYRRDNYFPQDDLNWFLLEKR